MTGTSAATIMQLRIMQLHVGSSYEELIGTQILII
jgi:hypothetical protein